GLHWRSEGRVSGQSSRLLTRGPPLTEVADLVLANLLAGGLSVWPQRGRADHGIGVGGSRDSTELGSSWSHRPKEHGTCSLMSSAAASLGVCSSVLPRPP